MHSTATTPTEGLHGSGRRPATDLVARARALFLAAAFLSFVASVALYFTGNETEGIFVGLWVPSILALGALILSTEARR